MFVKMRKVIDEEKAWWNCEELHGLNHELIFIPLMVSLILLIGVVAGLLSSGGFIWVFFFIINLVITILYYNYAVKNNSKVHISRDEKVLMIKKTFREMEYIYVDQIRLLKEYTATSPRFIKFHYYSNGIKKDVFFCPQSEPFLFLKPHPTYLRLKKLPKLRLRISDLFFSSFKKSNSISYAFASFFFHRKMTTVFINNELIIGNVSFKNLS